MTIETKYNIGDEVWISYVLSQLRCVVKSIIVTENEQIRYILVTQDFGFDNFQTGAYERDVFRTKQELLDSLPKATMD